jgi:hypothetical protein
MLPGTRSAGASGNLLDIGKSARKVVHKLPQLQVKVEVNVHVRVAKTEKGDLIIANNVKPKTLLD